MKWTAEHNKAVYEYITCVSASTSASTRHYIFNHILYTPINKIIEIIHRQNGKYNINEDLQQDMLLYAYDKVLPKLDISRYLAAQQLLYIALTNYYTSYVRMAAPKYSCNNTNELNDEIYSISEYVNIDEVKQEILKAINDKIAKEKQINKAKTLYLLLLKEYLLENNFDEREFGNYVKDKMNMSKNKYQVLTRSLNLSVIPFNRKYIEEVRKRKK